MNASTQKLWIQGPAGRIEVLVDAPAPDAAEPGVAAKGVVVIAHPHPLFGGTMDNKVVQTLARAFVSKGWTSVRFNFRGVGDTEGVHDHGIGEAQDFLAVVQHLAPEASLALAGFSFGAFVATKALDVLVQQRQLGQLGPLILVGTAASRFEVSQIPADLHERTLVVHGELDDTVPLFDVMNWARPQVLPVTVVPGGSHFFHGQLPLLKSLVVRHLSQGVS